MPGSGSLPLSLAAAAAAARYHRVPAAIPAHRSSSWHPSGSIVNAAAAGGLLPQRKSWAVPPLSGGPPGCLRELLIVV